MRKGVLRVERPEATQVHATPDLDSGQPAFLPTAYRSSDVTVAGFREGIMAEGITRREFLKGTGAVITGVAVLEKKLSAAEGGGTGTEKGERRADSSQREILLSQNAYKLPIFEALVRRAVLDATKGA